MWIHGQLKTSVLTYSMNSARTALKSVPQVHLEDTEPQALLSLQSNEGLNVTCVEEKMSVATSDKSPCVPVGNGGGEKHMRALAASLESGLF